MKRALLLTTLALSGIVRAERFTEGSNPSFFSKISGTQIITKMNLLPLKGQLSDDRFGWSETYWPSNLGGIAYRWNHPNPEPFKYRKYTKDELKKLTLLEMSQLSPAELYDIAMGDYNYTLTKKAMSLYTPRDLWWEGICHGWSQAATNYPEPDKVTIMNKDGIKVPFGSSDVKGLLAMHEAYNYKSSTYAFLGKRCKASGKVPGEGDDRDRNVNPPSAEEANTVECRDVNAGAFHIVIANMLGIHGKGFVADVDRFNDVWNQPVTHYSTKILGEIQPDANESAAGVERKIKIALKMTYGEELQFKTPERVAAGKLNFVSKNPVTGTVHQEFRFKEYQYFIELDASGNIIGGEWLTETRPDFMWLYTRVKEFRNSPAPLGGLGKIYKPVKRR